MNDRPFTPLTCCICSRPAMGVYPPAGERPYCRYHRPWIGRAIQPNDVYSARAMQLMGWPLLEIARELNVHSTDLDVCLWRALGRADLTGIRL